MKTDEVDIGVVKDYLLLLLVHTQSTTLTTVDAAALQDIQEDD